MKDLIIAPVITEKTASMGADGKTYVFKVSKTANKTQIKDAIESAFNVKVSDIRTLNTKAKDKRVGRYTGKTKTYKKAIVTLVNGNKIDL